IMKGEISVTDIWDSDGNRRTNKAAVSGDDTIDDNPPPPDVKSVGVPAKHRPISFDTVNGVRMQFPNQRALATWLAAQERIHKSSEDITMITPKEKLSDFVKRVGITAIAAEIIKSNSAYSLNEHQLTDLVTEQAMRDYPALSPAQAFTRAFTAQDEAGVTLRRAFNVVKNAAHESDDDDSAAAYRELEAIGKRDYPHLPSYMRFTKAFEANPQLAARAHRRPGPSTSFAHPVAKEKQPMTASLTPAVSDNKNVDSPEAALAQLRRIARDKWPTESEARAFLNAITDPENAEIVNLALRRPNESSPPRITG